MPFESCPKPLLRIQHLTLRPGGCLFLIGILTSCLLAGTLFAQTRETADAGQLRPGVVFDVDSALVVLMQPDGRSEAVQIADGKTVWVSDAAGKPLIIVQDRVFAQSEAENGILSLTILDLTSGAPVGRVQAKLPEGVVALIDDQIDSRFEIEARATVDGILLQWTQTVQPIAAVERLQKKAVTTQGIVRIDQGGETIEPLEGDQLLALFQDPPPNLIDNERIKGEGVQFRSAAGNAILMTEQIADNRTWEKYRWSIFDPTDGALIGTFDDFQRYSRFAVFGRVLLQEVAPNVRISGQDAISNPLSVRGIDLAGGTEIWSRQIRDTTYRGPLPP